MRVEGLLVLLLSSHKAATEPSLMHETTRTYASLPAFPSISSLCLVHDTYQGQTLFLSPSPEHFCSMSAGFFCLFVRSTTTGKCAPVGVVVCLFSSTLLPSTHGSLFFRPVPNRGAGHITFAVSPERSNLPLRGKILFTTPVDNSGAGAMSIHGPTQQH